VQQFAENQINWQGEFHEEVEVIKLKDNKFPEGVLPFVKIFDRYDMYKRKKEEKKPDDVIEINIASVESPKLIRIGKHTSLEERKELENLIREYKDVFAWTYDDLKAYKDDIIQHTIPLKDTKHFRQKQRQINPKFALLIQKELQKMLAAQIIDPTRHSSWVANLVVVKTRMWKSGCAWISET
jgi:hypothetical protein